MIGTSLNLANAQLAQSPSTITLSHSASTFTSYQFLGTSGTSIGTLSNSGNLSLIGTSLNLANAQLAQSPSTITLSHSASTFTSYQFLGTSGTPVALLSNSGNLVLVGTSLQLGSTSLAQNIAGSTLDVSLSSSSLNNGFRFLGTSGTSLATLSNTGNLTLTKGSLGIQDVLIQQNAVTTSIDFVLPSNAHATTFNFISTNNTVAASISDGGDMTVTGTLTVDADVLATGDFNVTGDTTLYGDVTIKGNLNLFENILYLGAGTGGDNLSGLGIGTNSLALDGSFLYTQTSSYASGSAFVSSIPMVYKGSTTTAEVGNGGLVTVYNNTDKTNNFCSLGSDNLTFGTKWRMRHDHTNDQIVFEYLGAGTNVWATKMQLVSN